MAKNTQLLVNGKPMTNEQYLALLKQASDARAAYKDTPEYQTDLEAKRKATSRRKEMVTKFIDFGKKLGIELKEIGNIGYAVYMETRKEQE
jgi:hypothetical protein